MNQITFIGAGSANIFAAMYLVEKMGFRGDVIFYDKGKSPHERTREGKDGLLFGFAGAGLWSDGKLVFSQNQDLTVTGMKDRIKCHNYIKYVVGMFTDGLNGVNVSTVRRGHSIDYLCEAHGMNFLYNEIYHLGTDLNAEFGKKMYDYMVDIGIVFNWEHDVKSINPITREVLIGTNNGMIRHCYDHVQIGVGKTGSSLIRNTLSSISGIRMKYVANIGMRFECPYNDSIDSIARGIQYDYKFTKEYRVQGRNVSIRTFCVNNYSAQVIREPITTSDGMECKTYNGHAYGFKMEKFSDTANFGIIMRIDGVDADFSNSILMRVLELGDGNDITISMSHKSVKDGISKGFVPTLGAKAYDNSVKLSLDEDIDRVVGIEGFSGCIANFISCLSDILKFDCHICWFPEIKMSSGILLTNKNYVPLNGGMDNTIADGRISFVGDATTGGVGIVPSAVTGIMSVTRL